MTQIDWQKFKVESGIIRSSHHWWWPKFIEFSFRELIKFVFDQVFATSSTSNNYFENNKLPSLFYFINLLDRKRQTSRNNIRSSSTELSPSQFDVELIEHGNRSFKTWRTTLRRLMPPIAIPFTGKIYTILNRKWVRSNHSIPPSAATSSNQPARRLPIGCCPKSLSLMATKKKSEREKERDGKKKREAFLGKSLP